LQKAHQAYVGEDYENVLNALKLIPSESQYYAKSLLLSGVAHFQLQENKNAVNQFKKILNNHNLSGNDDARKFLALIYLQTNQLEEAKRILKEIIELEDKFTEEAKKLLKGLRE
ncbi:MAG: tetratricopeptide repeat protein, partial [Chitinophagales bacterium]